MRNPTAAPSADGQKHVWSAFRCQGQECSAAGFGVDDNRLSNIVNTLALTAEFGNGFPYASLRMMRQFYRAYPDFEICHALCAKFPLNHIRLIMRVSYPSQQNGVSELQPVSNGCLPDGTRIQPPPKGILRIPRHPLLHQPAARLPQRLRPASMPHLRLGDQVQTILTFRISSQPVLPVDGLALVFPRLTSGCAGGHNQFFGSEKHGLGSLEP